MKLKLEIKENRFRFFQWRRNIFLCFLCFGLALSSCTLNFGRSEAPAGSASGHVDQDDRSNRSAGSLADPGEAPPETKAAAETEADAEGTDLSSIVQTGPLRDAVTVEGMRRHLSKLQEIADANDGLRTSGTPGYDASAEYVRAMLEEAGYEVTVQTFDFPFFHDATELAQITPEATTYTFFDDFAAMTFSPGGEVTASLQPVDIDLSARRDADSGCQASDFADFEPGNIALILRGVCPFFDKASNAEAAGASAVLVFNDGLQRNRQGVIRGTLGEPGINIPVVGLSFALGEALYQLSLSDEVVMQVNAQVISETRQTKNIIAATPGGRDDFVVVVGAHLDSAPTGPGIQDNGSGSAAILEIALQLAALGIEPLNEVRFAFWGAEEFGLLGSRYYVEQLSLGERRQIALNLNFDMIASPNYARFVHDGDHSTFAATSRLAAPRGSGAIEQVFQDYFAGQNLAVIEIPFDGRSDYGSFIRADIPAGGLFTGADDLKPPGEATIYGGTADEAYDPCYHLACDTIDNINWRALDEMSDAAAHAVLIFAMIDELVEAGTGQ